MIAGSRFEGGVLTDGSLVLCDRVPGSAGFV